MAAAAEAAAEGAQVQGQQQQQQQEEEGDAHRARHIYAHASHVGKAERAAQKGQRGCVVWLTGLSGSGKSTVASRAEQMLVEEFGAHTMSLDGDNVRTGLNADLGFSAEDRAENVRRIGEVAKLFVAAGIIVFCPLISPTCASRGKVRASLEEGEFVEVFVSTALEVCEARDVKGLYAKARRNEIPEFTGISAPYEPPTSPELTLNSDGSGERASVDDMASELVHFLADNGYVGDRVASSSSSSSS